MTISAKEQFEILQRGVVDCLAQDEFRQLLTEAAKKKKPLRIKYGADPSAPDLHLGHTVPLRKLRQFQDFGHQVVFIIGDFTARIGDPSQRSETRPMLTCDEVKANALTYQEQVFRILDRNKTEVRYNSEWLDAMTPTDFLNLTSKYTVARLLERDDFKKRFENNRPIALVEFMYPLLQGYDSVAIQSDLELGGTDQTFNLLVGRELQKDWAQKPQVVMTLPLLEGTDGTQKMSKSYGNHIAIQDAPQEMFGKVMSLPDHLMERYFVYVSGLPRDEAEKILADLKSGEMHPREGKAKLAHTIVSFFHSAAKADEALDGFNTVFRDKGMPEDMPEFLWSQGEVDIVTLLKEAGLVASKGEARRMIQQGGVRLNAEKVTDVSLNVALKDPVILQCGKRKFAKVKHG